MARARTGLAGTLAVGCLGALVLGAYLGSRGGSEPAAVGATFPSPSPVAVVTSPSIPGPPDLSERAPRSSAGEAGAGLTEGLARADLYQALADREASGLAPRLAVRLGRLAAWVVKADVTGRGRKRFPAYWGRGPHRVCCCAVAIEASGPFARRPGIAVAVVAWRAVGRATGAPLRRFTVVWLRRAEAGRWSPVHPWEVGG